MLSTRYRIKPSSSAKIGGLLNPIEDFIKSLNSNKLKPSKDSPTKSQKKPNKPNTPTKSPPKHETHKRQTSNASEKPTKLTPYQGKMRAYGFFKCQDCRREWTSGYSWANKGQQCMACEINVYPYRQRKLLKKPYKKGEIRKPHQRKLCEKCKELGYSCTEYRPSNSYVSVYREREVGRDFN